MDVVDSPTVQRSSGSSSCAIFTSICRQITGTFNVRTRPLERADYNRPSSYKKSTNQLLQKLPSKFKGRNTATNSTLSTVITTSSDTSTSPTTSIFPNTNNISSKSTTSTTCQMTESVDYENVYRMNHMMRGRFVIINNIAFSSQTEMSFREGTDLDATALSETFTMLGFVSEIHTNLTTEKMYRLVREVSKEDHGQCDCFGMAVLSHGDDGVVYGTDGVITIDTLVAPIRVCKSLAGKPKLLFIQACRGNALDNGLDVTDSDGVESQLQTTTYKIPIEADFLYAYSTPPGYYSFRSPKQGSWFIQALCQIFQQHGNQMEIIRLLTRVNRKVANEYESFTKDKALNCKKQIPSVVSMLTKELYFLPKS